MSAEGKKDRECVHIATAFDRNYLQPFYALMVSLVRLHSGGQVHIHSIAEGLSDTERADISRLIENSGNQITFYDADPSLIKQFVLRGKWPSIVYYRLFLPHIISMPIDRFLYLDCDTIIVNPLWELYHTDLGKNPVAAVYDNYVRTQPLLGITQEGEYFNSGVMLIDTIKWKKQRISENASEYLLAHPERILFVDQCALNAVLRHNWKKMETRFNLMYSVLGEGLNMKTLRGIVENAVVVHFTLQRPWHMLCRNRLRYLYLHNLKASGLKGLPWRGYTDFEVRKFPAWVKIRMYEIYFDAPFVQRVWRFLRSK